MDVKRFILALVAGLAATVLVACATTPPPTPEIAQAQTASPTTAPTPTRPFVPQSLAVAPERQVSLRFVNAAPGYEALDVYAEQLALATQLRFGTSSSGARITEGDFVISVYESGTSTTSEPLLRAPLSFAGNNYYTILLSNRENTLRLAAIPDDRSALSPGQSRILVLHAAPSVGNLDIGLSGQQTLIEGLQFSQSSPSISFPAGRIVLQASTSAGEIVDTTVNLRDGYGYTLIFQGEQPQWVEYEERVPGQATAYFINAMSPELGTMDFYLNGARTVSDLVFGATSDPQTIAADNSTLRVQAAGTPEGAQPLIEMSLTMNNGDFIAFVAIGDANTARLVPLIAPREIRAEGNAAVAFLNVYPDTPSMLDNGEGIIEQPIELSYGIPLTIETLPGEQRFYWRESRESAGDVQEFFDPRTFTSGSTYLYVFTGRDDAPVIALENALPQVIDAAPAAVVTSPIRWVNAIPDTSVTFTLNDRPAVENLVYAQAEVSQEEQGTYSLSVATGAGRSQEIIVDAFSAEPQHIFAYGTAEDPQIQLIQDQRVGNLNEDIARIRLTYLAPSSSTRTLSLAFDPSLRTEINSQFLAVMSGSTATTLPFGAQILVQGTAAGSMSLAGQLPVGNYELYILDDQRNGVIATIAAAPLEGNRVYEIVVVQSVFTQEILVFVLNVEPSS